MVVSGEKGESFSDYKLKVLVLGVVGVGKTSFIRRAPTSCFEGDYEGSIGVNEAIRRVGLPEASVLLNFWDVSGSSRWDFVRSSYYKGARCAVLLYDVTREASFSGLSDFVDGLEDYDCLKYSFLVGNKRDLSGEREVDSFRGVEFALSNGLDGFVEVSSRTGYNVEGLFRLVALRSVYDFPFSEEGFGELEGVVSGCGGDCYFSFE